MRQLIDIVSEGTVIKPPRVVPQTNKPKIFLAGSIDMGKASDWQTEVTRALADVDVVIFNPRRDDWDSSWKQDITSKPFNEQVSWELDQQDAADLIVMYFDPEGQAPITLMELGLYAASRKIICCCPEGYWRRGNVQIVCQRYGLPLVDSLEDLITLTKERLSEL